MQPNAALSANSSALRLTSGALLLFVGGFVVLYWSGNAALLNFVYPAAGLLITGMLYVSQPALFIGFVWWIWFITPFVRRLIDYQTGYTSLSPVMLTPLLATAFTAFTVLRYGKLLQDRAFLPFGLAILGVIYGFMVGFIKTNLAGAAFSLATWIAPICFGFHLAVFWREYPAYRQAIRSTFMWGVFVMGLYGVIQFFVVPPWDAQWVADSGMTAIGRPEPFQLRVFATLNSPGPYALALLVGVLLLLDGRGVFPVIALVPAFAAFLLTRVRSAWAGWIIVLVFMIWRLRGPMRARLLGILGVGLVLSLPLLTQSPIGDTVGGRLETLGNLDEDNSLRARTELYEVAFDKAILNPIGEGLGAVGRAAKLTSDGIATFDSGILAIPYTLGWPGTLAYMGGVLMLLLRVVKIRERDADQFAVICAGIAGALIAMLFISNSFSGFRGLVFWCFAAMAASGQLFHGEQNDYAQHFIAPDLYAVPSGETA